jgi:hypothetical protein
MLDWTTNVVKAGHFAVPANADAAYPPRPS